MEGDPKGEEYRRLNDWLARYGSHVSREEEGLDCDLADDAPEDCPVCSMGDDDDDMWTPDVLRQRLELELLTDSQIETAVVRGFEAWENAQGEGEAPIKVPTLGEGDASNWAEVQAELGTRAGFLRMSHRRPGFVKKLEKYDLPDGFPDLDECLQRCTWGAVYGQQFDGEKPKLYCTNQKHFEEKRDRGKAEWVEGIQERARKEAEEDQALVQDLVFADQRTLLRHVAVTLMAEQSALEKAKIGGWDSAHLWYEYITSKRVRELLGVEALDSESEGVGYYERATAVSFNRDQRRGSVSSEMVERVNALELPDLQHLVANLVAYTFRVRLSIVGGSPPQNEDTAGEGESIDDGEGDEGVDGELEALSV